MENKKLTLQELESHLWGAADILRGAIDAADYKHYIFGLLFYKRLSDVWEEEYEARLAEFEDEKLAKDPEEHRFHIPEDCFWSDVKKKTTNIGEALNASFRAIEDSNKRLKDVFQDIDFNNKRRFPDATLELLIQHFDKHSLKKKDVSADMLGNAYEYLIAKFADDAGSKGGEFYTPKEVVRLIVECLQPDEGMSIYDPTCGSAGMLLEAFHFMERKKKNPKRLRLYGQEKNLNTWAISQMNLFLHDIDDAFVERGDTITEPKHIENEGSKKIKTFDLIMANPPFSLKNWGHDSWKDGDAYGRDKYGCPPRSYGDLAFIQHMIASMGNTGKVGVVVPHGVLFRGGAEGKIRKAIITDSDDVLDAVIGLPAGLFYGAGIPTALLIFNKNKNENRKNKILFINAELGFEDRKVQKKLRDCDIKKISETYLNYSEVKRYSKIAELEEISSNDFNLNIRRYADCSPPPENFDVKGILHGGIPVYEIEDDFVSETLKEFDLNLVLSSQNGGFRYFKDSIKSKSDIKTICHSYGEGVKSQLERFWDKYHLSLSDIDFECKKSDEELSAYLKGMGYE